MDTDCTALVGSFPAARAKISNDLYRLDGFDGRSSVARRYRDVVRGLLADMGADEDQLTATAKVQVRTPGLLAIQVERLQHRALSGETIDGLDLTRKQNTLNRLLWALGIGRRKPEPRAQPIPREASP
jgi:hypothetical protein